MPEASGLVSGRAGIGTHRTEPHSRVRAVTPAPRPASAWCACASPQAAKRAEPLHCHPTHPVLGARAAAH